MTLFNHVLAGGLVAVLVPTPLAPLVALGSHFVLDAFPHFGRHPTVHPYTKPFWYMLAGDAVLSASAFVLILVLFPEMRLLSTLCVFLSALPDFLWPLMGKVKWLNGFFSFAKNIQWGERPWGWILEILYGTIFVAMLISLSY